MFLSDGIDGKQCFNAQRWVSWGFQKISGFFVDNFYVLSVMPYKKKQGKEGINRDRTH